MAVVCVGGGFWKDKSGAGDKLQRDREDDDWRRGQMYMRVLTRNSEANEDQQPGGFSTESICKLEKKGEKKKERKKTPRSELQRNNNA